MRDYPTESERDNADELSDICGDDGDGNPTGAWRTYKSPTVPTGLGQYAHVPSKEFLMPCFCGFCGGLCGLVISLVQSIPVAFTGLPLTILKVWKRRHLDGCDDGCTHGKEA